VLTACWLVPYFSWAAAAMRFTHANLQKPSRKLAKPWCPSLLEIGCGGSFQPSGSKGVLGESAYGVVSCCCPPAVGWPLYFDVCITGWAKRPGVFPPPIFIPIPQVQPRESVSLFSRSWKGLVAMFQHRLVVVVFRSWSSGPCQNVAAAGCFCVYGLALPGDQCLVGFCYQPLWLAQPPPTRGQFPISRLTEWNGGKGALQTRWTVPMEPFCLGIFWPTKRYRLPPHRGSPTSA